MKLRDLFAGIPFGGEWYDENLEITSVTADSRQVQPGALFAALPGTNRNGEDFIPGALERGAVAVLCSRAPDFPGPWLAVKNPRAAYATVCANWFGNPADTMHLVAVTGTNGKTTTTTLLYELLSGVTGAKVGLIGTNRNLIGGMELPACATTPDSYTLHALLRQMADARPYRP